MCTDNIHKLNHDGVTLVLGGTRSGKSSFAEQLISNSGLKPVYLATARGEDEEMRKRIRIHRERRERHSERKWQTIEEPLALVGALQSCTGPGRAILVDCLTLWFANLMAAEMNMEHEVAELAQSLDDFSAPVVFVSNETGMSIVPENTMAREFNDLAGMAHQTIASRARDVYFIVAGVPLAIKSEKPDPVNDITNKN